MDNQDLFHSMEKNMKEYENFKKGEMFRKVIYDVKPNYEFERIKIGVANEALDPAHTLPALVRVSFYFIKESDYTCREIVTGKLFYRTDEDIFYNEETGLSFDINRCFERTHGDEKYIELIEYRDAIENYINCFVNLKKKDDKKEAMGRYALLQRGINFIGR